METIIRARTAPHYQRAVSSGLRQITLALLTILVVGGIIFASVWRHVAFVSMGYEISTLQRDHERLLDRKRELEIERSMLSSPDRIEKLAQERLGLKDPEPGQVCIIQ